MALGLEAAVLSTGLSVRAQEPQATDVVLAQEQREIQDTLRILLDFAKVLLSEADPAVSLSAALDRTTQPVRPRGALNLRLPLFARTSPSDCAALGDVYANLWLARLRSLCVELSAVAYDAAERRFRARTILDSGHRPGVTLSLVWFILAAHNWAWWWNWARVRSGDPVASGNEAAPKLEADLLVDVDLFLDRLAKSDCQAGDLLVMHMMTVQLEQWISERMKESSPTGGSASEETPQTARIRMPDSLARRWTKIRLASPVSRLVAITAAKHPSDVVMESPAWSWLAVLLNDPGAEPIRQYWVSQLGQRLSDPRTPVPQIQCLLRVLGQWEGVVRPDCDASKAKDGWNCFLARLLWAALDAPRPEDLPCLWDRWAQECPGEVSLAHWCGRLAYRAEQAAQETRDRHLPEWMWIWRDLAGATVLRWLTGRGRTILCLGLWLEGYCENRETVPPLVLGGRVLPDSFERIVALWHASVRTVREGTCPQYEDLAEQKALEERLSRQVERLIACPAFAEALARNAAQEPSGQAASPAPQDAGTDTEVQVETKTRIYPCKQKKEHDGK